jgi:hypothetical protein
LGYLHGDRLERREVSISENWGFALFETDRYKLVVDEDSVTPCWFVDLAEDPHEDVNGLADPTHAAAVDELMERYVHPFLASPPARPHTSPFT